MPKRIWKRSRLSGSDKGRIAPKWLAGRAPPLPRHLAALSTSDHGGGAPTATADAALTARGSQET